MEFTEFRIKMQNFLNLFLCHKTLIYLMEFKEFRIAIRNFLNFSKLENFCKTVGL